MSLHLTRPRTANPLRRAGIVRPSCPSRKSRCLHFIAKNGELAPWAEGTTLRCAPITTMEPTKIRSNNQSSCPAHRVAKTCVDKRPADGVAVLLRKAFAARHLVPGTAHLLFHVGYDFL